MLDYASQMPGYLCSHKIPHSPPIESTENPYHSHLSTLISSFQVIFHQPYLVAWGWDGLSISPPSTALQKLVHSGCSIVAVSGATAQFWGGLNLFHGSLISTLLGCYGAFHLVAK